MSLDNQTTLGDYAPQPQRRRVSRGRKALIGLMAIGAFAAVGGAGTFASFTASTDNAGGALGDGDNPFQTGLFELANTVTDVAGTALPGNFAPCLSSDDDVANLNDGSEGLKVGENAALCDVLFTGDITGGLTSYVTIENTGDDDGQLVLFALDQSGDPCVVDVAGTTSNCGDIELTIQEYYDTAGTGPGTGDAVVNYGTATANGDCVFGKYDAGGTPTNADKLADADGACIGGRLLSELPTFSDGVIQIDDVLPAEDGATPNLNNDVRYFKVDAELPPDLAICGPDGDNDGILDADDGGTDPALEDGTTSDGYHDTTGIGCHNSAMDKSAKFTLRWLLQGA